jgi:RNA polymerase sigma-70 factor (ECF subfamily)
MIDGDEFLRLLLRHELDLKAFIGSLVLDTSLREDILQEVVLTLWRRLADYDAARPFGAWARGIAAKKILKLREENQKFPLLFSPEVIQSIADAFDRTEETPDHRLDALRECLKLLPERSHQMLQMRYEQGLCCGAIAHRTHNTLEAVYQALSRLRARLEECVRERLATQK